MNKAKTYDLIISIGQACSCTESLRARNLQKFSYPLDWLYGATFLERVDLVASHFNRFFEKDDFKFVERLDNHPFDIYQNTFNGLVFNHDFPKNVPLELSFPELKAKYDRRINRLLDTINTSQNVLFVYIESGDAPILPDLNSKLLEAQKKLQKAFLSTKCDILYLQNDRNMETSKIIYEDIAENILKVTLFNVGPNYAIAPYQINFNNTNKVLSGLTLNYSDEYAIGR